MDFGACWVVLSFAFVSVLGSMVVIAPLPNALDSTTPSRILRTATHLIGGATITGATTVAVAVVVALAFTLALALALALALVVGIATVAGTGTGVSLEADALSRLPMLMTLLMEAANRFRTDFPSPTELSPPMSTT